MSPSQGEGRGFESRLSLLLYIMKTIKFTPELTELIKKGKKTTTFRLFDDKNLTIGDTVILATRDKEKITEFGKGKIVNIRVKTLNSLDEDDYIGHEKVHKTNLLDYYKSFYGEKVEIDTEVKVIRFKVIEIFD